MPKIKEENPFKPGWLKKVAQEVKKEIATWPQWQRDAVDKMDEEFRKPKWTPPLLNEFGGRSNW